MDKYYLGSVSEITKYCEMYLPLVFSQTKEIYKINILESNYEGDHLGVQTSSTDEYEEYFKLLSSYMNHKFTNILHGRRVAMFSFMEEFKVQNIKFNGIEIFEPKKDSDTQKLKLGIEHLAIVVKNFDDFAKEFPEKYIGKIAEYPEGKFLKTKFMNLVEIEFRDRSLI